VAGVRPRRQGVVPRCDEREAIVSTRPKRYFTIPALLTGLAFGACEAGALAAVEAFPPTPAQPTVVRVGVVIRNLIAIDEVKESWQVTGLLIAKWTNRSVRFRSAGPADVYRELPANIWKPDFEFTNEVTPTNFRFVDFYAEPNGTVVYTQTFSATLKTILDLRRFPYDSEVLPVVVQAAGDDLDRTILRPDRQDSALPKRSYAGLAQWVPLSLTERLGTVAGSASRANDVEFGLKVQRNPKSYILKFIVPLLLLVIISWITFWLSHEEFKTKDQLQSAVSTLLIIVAFNITATSLLPRTEYITYIDALLFTCFIFVIISIATIVGTHLLQINHSEQRALRVRRVAGYLLPAMFLVVQAILFIGFHVAG
jgi:Neurotransmitter-gated ion-channel ligand binding domain